MGAGLAAPNIVDLRRLDACRLEPLLDEEIRSWKEELDWDFSRSADLVRRYVDMRALNGAAALEDEAAAGYVYFVLEDGKALIGDMYVARERRGVELENALLERALFEISAHPGVDRVESQLMLLRWPPGRPAPGPARMRAFERNFMRVDLESVRLAENRVRKLCYIERWSDHYLDAAAPLIAAAYVGHIDGAINDQYRSASGARRFLHSIVQYPGCGVFAAQASFAAFEPKGPTLCGISLASKVAPECGHITQICVSPEAHGKGLGYALLRRSLLALKSLGCRSASLTVTAANQEAVRLYERVGFYTARVFPALVWDNLSSH
jgi:ribosomal protein S18 acetylase RimI-like enzyme